MKVPEGSRSAQQSTKGTVGPGPTRELLTESGLLQVGASDSVFEVCNTSVGVPTAQNVGLEERLE